MKTISFKLREGYNRAVVGVQGRDDCVAVEADDVLKTDDPEVIRSLDGNPAVERVAHKPKASVEVADHKTDDNKDSE